MRHVRSIPFPKVFPHVVTFDDGATYELCCPECKGNARERNPSEFFDGVRAVMNHIRMIHPNCAIEEQDLFWSGLRRLTPEEFNSIKTGDYKGLIVRQKAAKVDGQPSKAKPEALNIPFLHYPIVVKTKDDKFVQLACVFCGGNSQTIKGVNRNSPIGIDHLTFFVGARGLLGHIVNSHQDELRGQGQQSATIDWVIRNCGTQLDEETMKQLKADINCRTITMVKASSKKKVVASAASGSIADELDGDDGSDIEVVEVIKDDSSDDELEDVEDGEPIGNVTDLNAVNVPTPKAAFFPAEDKEDREPMPRSPATSLPTSEPRAPSPPTTEPPTQSPSVDAYQFPPHVQDLLGRGHQYNAVEPADVQVFAKYHWAVKELLKSDDPLVRDEAVKMAKHIL